MTSHGVPRASVREDRNVEARNRELQEIKAYQALVEDVNTKVRAKDYTPQLLQKTAELLKKNPEYYTIWNYRRQIFTSEFEELQKSASTEQIREDVRVSQVLDIIQLDLQFLFPLLLKFPKCYWIWNHRLWLLDQSTLLLPAERSRQLWEEELGLVGKMLSRDSRNFHGWGYRRIVVQNLESPMLNGSSMARKEFEYTTKMIGTNLSNFSAWHNRTKLILRFLDEEQATDQERQKMLDEELKLIHEALFDPYDQSLWFYHQNLMCTFDSDYSARTMAPRLSTAQKLEYLSQEREFVDEVLEDATDCKWVYQALIEITMLRTKLQGAWSDADKDSVNLWLVQLKMLDPLRTGRWKDLEASLRSLK